jgi:hypothetical protein
MGKHQVVADPHVVKHAAIDLAKINLKAAWPWGKPSKRSVTLLIASSW